MIFGTFVLMAIFAIFTITHFIKFTGDQPALELAGELALIILAGLGMIMFVVVARHFL